jgi:hypothetical protein
LYFVQEAGCFAIRHTVTKKVIGVFCAVFRAPSTVTTRIWMDRNLGVDQGLDINTITSKQILDSTVVCTSGVVLVTVTRL